MKVNSAISKFLTNKMVLNVVAFLALFNVIGYLVMGNLNSVLYFIVVAVLVRYFSKNMTIVLGVPLIIVNLLAIKGNVLEGMENGTNTTNSVTKPSKDNEQEKINDMVSKNTSNTTSVINNSAASTVSTSPNNPAQETGEKQGFEPGRRKNRGYDIDYATTIEDAYDELNNILGSDGIHRLTSDTQNLMKQQMQLAEAMKGMTPVIKQIAPMVENLKGMMGQMGDGQQGLEGIMNLAKKFSGQTTPTN
jgi:hypothetical protein